MIPATPALKLPLTIEMIPRLVAVVVVPGLLALFLHSRFLRTHKGVPMRLPGPPRHWLFGHLFHMPKESPWLALMEWSKLYDIFSLRILGTSIVVLNTMDAITDLFEKRGSIYSDRPKLTMAGELMGLDQTTGMMAYGPTWRQHRKLCRVALVPDVVRKYIPMQEETARTLLREILHSPAKFIPHLRLATSRIIMNAIYGLTISSADDIYITEIENVLTRTSKAFVPGAYLVDIIPALKHLPPWLPFTSFLSEAAAVRNDGMSSMARPFEHVKREIAYGRALPSFTADLLLALDSKTINDTQPNNDDTVRDSNTIDRDEATNMTRAAEEELIKVVAGSMFGAGGETTYGALLTLILALTLYPAVQAKAQAELDGVLGSQADRLPTLADVTGLPYLGALVREVLRWRPVLPLGIARRLTEDDVYKGYHIPAGSTVMPNVWALAYAPCSPTDPPPHVFEPDRFLSSTPPLDPLMYIFGFGRRICPGRQLAYNTLLIFSASLLTAFRFSTPPEEVKFGTGLVSFPEPFECQIEVRSDGMRKIILSEEM